MISPNDIRCYYEGWRNGKHGSICQWDGIYRFVEQVRGGSGELNDIKSDKDDNPIVAIGIVAYWLQFNSRINTVIKRLIKYKCEIPKDIREQFDNYTEIRFNQFKQMYRDDPITWDWDWEYEFYVNTIIPHEMDFNKRTEALFDYISDSDIAIIRAVMKNYIKYLKKTRAEKGYRINPELLVLRAVASQDDKKYEDLEDYEVNTILDKLESKGYIRVAWFSGHRPEGTMILDKGRTYLKQLEERIGVVEVAPLITPQFDEEADEEDFVEDEGHVEEDEGKRPNEMCEYDTTYDHIFDPRVNAKELRATLDDITFFDKRQHPFWFVFMQVLIHLHWMPPSTKIKDVLNWASLQYNLNWTTPKQLSFSDIGGDTRDMNRKTNEKRRKKIKAFDITQWQDISIMEFRDIEKYRQFALLLKKSFVHIIVDGVEKNDVTDFNLGKPRDRAIFMKFPNKLINWGK